MRLLGKRRSPAALLHWSPTDLCDRLDEPGAAPDDPELNYSARSATPDQLRIEQFIASCDLSGARLLHVGVGDSGLALRLHGRCQSIDGVTMSDAERQRAESLGLPGYRVVVANKYARDFVLHLRPGYQFIVDNNPASFACCTYHLAAMFDAYRWALAPGGELITDQVGLHWVSADRRWRMSYDDLAAAGRRFGLKARRLTETVFGLQRC